MPIAGDPPSVVGRGAGDPRAGNIPAIGGCGGHVDPFGYLHWHFGAPGDEQRARRQRHPGRPLHGRVAEHDRPIGVAKDGYPIYASQDATSRPTGLDACGGHTSATADYAAGVYHYHVSATDAPNVPACVVGASASRPFQVQ